VTRFRSTRCVLGAQTVTSYRYRRPFHDEGPVTLHVPLRSSNAIRRVVP
jgi:hypothetical protein